MEEQVDVVIREAVPQDAEGILKHTSATAIETGFMTMGEEGPGITVEEEEEQLAKLYESDNNVLLVALIDGQIIGTASIHGSSSPKLQHIGEIGIVIAKDFWGFGLGTTMMEELLLWADKNSILKRLELTVQARNKKARHLYEKLGFELEAIMPRGVKDNGEYLDVCLMSRMIGKID
ncbi:GNAT family N-acetyltransferase [Desemzia sp. RIT804]|uniref:GNAT family N-acetyltransferase n=1 Tax=Desemzia sp. RIT 804 TaxID=2810209 RepID=UPI00194ED638|nr:GNAT family protein [Desemzia sp. RIT 804]MBM6614628.1 GNAT family N-acetyltransferase [Desemzia sp. RIT 804]